MEIHEETVHLRGVEKAAVLFLCLQEGEGSKLMKELGEDDTRALIKAISTLGTIPALTVESVIREFSDSVEGRAGVMGSVETARRMLAGYLPESKVSEYLDEISGPRDNRSVWEDFASLNEQVIANYLRDERDQTVAAILYRLSQVKPQVPAMVLPHLGQDRMINVVERMVAMETLPRHVLQEIEEAISSELLSSATRKSGPDPHQRMADVFNKMDPAVFEQLATSMEARTPQVFSKIKQKMFTFDDLMRIDPAGLQRILRSCDNKTLAPALKAAKKEVREMFYSPAVMTVRAREMLQQDIADLGPIRSKDAREAQNKILELTFDLVRQELIVLPSEDDEMVE